jgi:non-lysosomal glucosylceramidase
VSRWVNQSDRRSWSDKNIRLVFKNKLRARSAWLAHITNLGDLVSKKNIATTLQSIYKYNYKRTLDEHSNVERTFALNDESAMIICHYGTTTRPRVSFPYFAEVMTGFEHSTAALMIFRGMVDQGVECIHNIRPRYDGEKRNPWDEAECGHHYARAMAAWSGVVAVSGFSYNGATGSLVAVPRVPHREFNCFWSTRTGWGTFSYESAAGRRTLFTLRVLAGTLPCSSLGIVDTGSDYSAHANDKLLLSSVERLNGQAIVHLKETVTLAQNDELLLEMSA